MTRPLSRGDNVLVRCPFTDLSGDNVRPTVVASWRIGPDVVLAFTTSRSAVLDPQTDVLIPVSHPGFSRSGLKVTSIVRLNKLGTLDRSLLTRRPGTLDSTLISDIDNTLRSVLGLW